jgi:hypothetical protein
VEEGCEVMNLWYFNKPVTNKGPWREYEDLILQAAVLHYSPTGESARDERVWQGIASCALPSRSAGDCQERWLSIPPRGENNGESSAEAEELTSEDNESLGVFKWVSEDPFLEICKFLTCKEVFQVLPLVCKRFRRFLKGNQIYLQHLAIPENAPAGLFIMMKERIRGCEELQLHLPHAWEGSFWSNSLDQLLRKLAASVSVLRCVTKHQSSVTKFINSSTRLRVVAISARKMCAVWNWELHQVRESVQELMVDEVGTDQGMLRLAFSAFPKMYSFSQLTRTPPYRILSSEMGQKDAENHAKVRIYRASQLMPIALMRSVQQLVLTIIDPPGITKLANYMPRMKDLKSLQVHITSLALSIIFKREPYNPFNRLIDAINQGTSLREVIVSKNPEEGNDRWEVYDETILWKLHCVLPHVIHIRYKRRAIR